MKSTQRYILILAMVILLWDVSFVQPLKIFSSYIHQIGHFIMALAFSYGVDDFSIRITGESYNIINPKGILSQFMVANAGYLGSMLFAFCVFYLKNTDVKKYVLGSVALVFVGITIAYSDAGEKTTYAMLFVAIVLFIYMIQSEKIKDWAIDIVGISSIVFAIIDTAVNSIFYEINTEFQIFTNVLVEQPYTDTLHLQDISGIPSLLWGLLWLTGSIIGVYLFFVRLSDKEKVS